uniref:Uncharacterized protein n=1 Tax=Ficedula albicollis TaxID=59894 RepID=A0A803VDK5_FICAL
MTLLFFFFFFLSFSSSIYVISLKIVKLSIYHSSKAVDLLAIYNLDICISCLSIVFAVRSGGATGVVVKGLEDRNPISFR